jgi:hypothetical protein
VTKLKDFDILIEEGSVWLWIVSGVIIGAVIAASSLLFVPAVA